MTPLFKRVLAIGLGLSALILIALIWLIFTNQPPLLPENNPISNTITVEEKEEVANTSSGAVAYEDLEWHTNSRGKKWALASNDSDFVVSSKDDGGIRFWEGNISPLKVAPGMTQNMKIVVSSPNGISSVTAMIETDNGTTTVELKKTGVLAARDLDERHGLYTVDENNILAINTAEEAAAYRLALAQAEEGNGPVNAALAASGEREIFEGSWEVKDTSVRDYITVFVARDAAGQEKTNILSWSDPCYNGGTEDFWPNGGNAFLSGDDCTLSSTYGVDMGDLTIENSTLTLGGGATLAFNPGYKITIGLGTQIILLPGASIQKKYLWAQDNDYDNYAVNSQRWLSTSPTAITQSDEGWIARLFSFFIPAQAQTGNVVRQNTIVSTEDDCYDSNANAFPGQTSYFPGQRGDGSFDYDCSNTITANATHECLGTFTDFSTEIGPYVYTMPTGVVPEFSCNSDLDCESTFGSGTCISGYCCVSSRGSGLQIFGCENGDTNPLSLPADCGSAYGFKSIVQVFSDGACSTYDPRLIYNTPQVECR